MYNWVPWNHINARIFSKPCPFINVRARLVSSYQITFLNRNNGFKLSPSIHTVRFFLSILSARLHYIVHSKLSAISIIPSILVTLVPFEARYYE